VPLDARIGGAFHEPAGGHCFVNAHSHLNLAVALAKLGRLKEAMLHFRETLRLDPSNLKAKDCLQALETIARPLSPPARGGD
jgi:hypothetical protein